MRNKRRKLWIDRFQTNLCIRIALYFVMFQASAVLTYHLGRVLFIESPKVMGLEISAFGVVVIVLMFAAFTTAFIWDAIKHTHRIVGPIVQFRRAIQKIAAGEELELLQLRKDDYLHELKDEFNEMLRVLENRGAIQLKTRDKTESVIS